MPQSLQYTAALQAQDVGLLGLHTEFKYLFLAEQVNLATVGLASTSWVWRHNCVALALVGCRSMTCLLPCHQMHGRSHWLGDFLGLTDSPDGARSKFPYGACEDCVPGIPDRG